MENLGYNVIKVFKLRFGKIEWPEHSIFFEKWFPEVVEKLRHFLGYFFVENVEKFQDIRGVDFAKN